MRANVDRVCMAITIGVLVFAFVTACVEVM